MYLRIKEWETIRAQFNDAEKKILNDAITGEVLCPRGAIVDEDRAGEVAKKIRSLLGDRLEGERRL